MNIAICGPNLRDQSKGQFHVHAAGCGDLKHYGRGKFGGEEPWVLSVSSKLEASIELNYDILGDYGLTPEDAEGEKLLLEWLGDMCFMPCCKELPLTSQPVS